MKEVKTTYLEILNQVNEDCETDFLWDKLFQAVELRFPNKLATAIYNGEYNENRIKAYQIYKGYSSGWIIGMVALFFDNTLVAVEICDRPYDTKIEFINSRLYKELKKYLSDLFIEYDDDMPNEYIYQDGKMETFGVYTLKSIDELCHKYAFLEGDIVEIQGKSENGKVKVVKKDKSTAEVDIKELVFKYNMP